jgi:hypothetical protein
MLGTHLLQDCMHPIANYDDLHTCAEQAPMRLRRDTSAMISLLAERLEQAPERHQHQNVEGNHDRRARELGLARVRTRRLQASEKPAFDHQIVEQDAERVADEEGEAEVVNAGRLT